MGARTKEDLRKMKRDTEEIYDVAYGKMYRARQSVSTVLTPQVISGNENLNALLDIIIEDAIDVEARNIDIYKDAKGYGVVQLRVGRDKIGRATCREDGEMEESGED